MSNQTDYESTGICFQKATSYPGGPSESPMTRGEAWPGPQNRKSNETELIKLPDPELPEASFWKTLVDRHSSRDFADMPMNMNTLSNIMYAVAGLKRKLGRLDIHLRTVPSAGALHPVETYAVCLNVENIKPGVYHYLPDGNSLEVIYQEDKSALKDKLVSACHGQKMTATAPLTLAWTGYVERCSWKYSQRAWRYLYLDAGHCGQNLYLAAEALGLGCCTIAAFMDDESADLLKTDPEKEPVLYLGAIGKTVDKS